MEEKAKRRRRTNSNIEESIMKAAIELIEDKGFLELAVTSITRKAKIEPVVFYNRYNNLTDFMDKFVKKYDYWFDEATKTNYTYDDMKNKYVNILSSLLKSLKTNKVMQQLLRWELSTNNEITQRTSQLREINTLPLVKEYTSYFSNTSLDIAAISSLIIGGIYYLTLHSNLTMFSQIDINSEEGEKRICKAIECLSDLLFIKNPAVNSSIEIIQKMKQNNISIEIISDCTGIPKEIISGM